MGRRTFLIAGGVLCVAGCQLPSAMPQSTARTQPTAMTVEGAQPALSQAEGLAVQTRDSTRDPQGTGVLPTVRNDDRIEMPAFIVTGKTYLSFDFAMSLVKIGNQISWAYVTKVKPGSDADIEGMRPYTHILSINGKPIQEFDATFSSQSELGRLLIGRKVGDRLVLEFRRDGSTETKTAVLVKKHVFESFAPE